MTILGRYHFAEKSRDWEVKGGALISAYGTKRQFARCKATSGVEGKADLPVERPDFSV
jgi:hypothetical protein